MSQFANDNHVYFEFNLKFCVVEDLLNQEILLQGKLDKGLYKFNFSNTRKSKVRKIWCNSSKSNVKNGKEIFDLCYCKLGHPSVNVVKQVLKNNDISFNVSLSCVCTYCQLGKNHKLPFTNSITVISNPLELVAIFGSQHQ